MQECGLVGLVRISRDGSRLAFAAPPLRRGGPLDEAEVEHIARTDVVAHAWCDNSRGWQSLLLKSAEAVLALQPDK